MRSRVFAALISALAGLPQGRAQSVTASNGFAMIERENAPVNVSPASGHWWVAHEAPHLFSGAGSMEAAPADGAPLTAGTSSPELQYAVNFTAPGTYYVWLRGYAASGTTAYVGLDEASWAAAPLALGGAGRWLWTNQGPATATPVAMAVSSTGYHTLDIWMGDAGVKVDEALPTLNPNYTPNASPEYWQGQSIYQVITDRFFNGDTANDNADGNYNPSSGTGVHGGDFKGIEAKLDYIKALGATAIWISPIVHNFFGDYHGYAGSDFYNVDPHWGSLADLQDMIQEAHRRGLLVIDDVICNHGSYLLDSTEPGYRHKFLYPPDGYTLKYVNPANQYSPPFDSRTTPKLEDLFHNNGVIQNFGDDTQVQYGALLGLDDFKTESPYIQRSMIAIYEYWVRQAGFDGFRVDTVKHVNQGFWQVWCPALRSAAARAGKPNFFTFGEVYDGWDAKCGSYTGTQAGGAYELDSVLDYPLYFAVKSVFASATGNTQEIENRYAQLAANYAPEAQNRLVTFLDNHDQPRFLSSGNASGDTGRLTVALVFLYTARGVPCLYYGTEQGFHGGADPKNREDMFAGQFQDGGAGVDNFNEASALFQVVGLMNNLRRLYPALLTGTHVNLWCDPKGPGLFAYSRRLGSREVYVILNTAGRSQTIPARPTIYPAGTVIENVLSPPETYTVGDGPQFPSITVPGPGAKVFVAQSEVRPLDPVVRSISPAHDAYSVPTAAQLVITFSKTMNTTAVQAAFRTAPTTSGSCSWSSTSSTNDTLTYTPAGGWAASTLYAVHLAATAADAVSGNTFHSPFDARFTTGTRVTQSLPPAAATTAVTNTGPRRYQ